MHATLQILEFWGLGLVALIVALVALGFFWSVIEQDLYFKSWRTELVVAAVASLIEAIGLWLLLPLGALGLRAMIVPGLAVGIIYKLSHLEDWSRYEIMALLVFELVISLVGAALLTGHFSMALSVAAVFAVALAVVAAFVKGL